MNEIARQFIGRVSCWLEPETVRRLRCISGRSDLPAEMRDWVFPELLDSSGRLRIAGFELDVPPAIDTWVLLREVFERQEYWFSADHAAVQIVDAGAHCGLSVAYFMALNPDCSVIAVEPRRDMAEMLRANSRRNNWDNVEIVEAALSRECGTAEYCFDQHRTMSGGLLGVRGCHSERESRYSVQTITLDSLISSEVDLLKIDIEGAEYLLMGQLESKLDLVKRVVIELHGQPADSLGVSKMMSLVERSGMSVLCAKSMGSERRSSICPMGFLDEGLSMMLYGSRPEVAAADNAAMRLGYS